MNTIQINVIDVSAPVTVKTAKGSYEYVEVAFKQDGKVSGKKIVDFANKEIYKAVKHMASGETYDVDIEKDGNDYWQWKKLTRVSGEAVAGEEPSTGKASGSVPASRQTSGRVTGSNYETPEERARRQVLIVRQSSLTAAIAVLTHNMQKQHINPDMVESLAETFVNFVFEKNPIKELQQMEDDVPL